MRIKFTLIFFTIVAFLAACVQPELNHSRTEICFFYPDGKLYSVSEMNENLQLDGRLYEYDQSGNLAREIYYKKGLIDGRYFTFFENGAVNSVHHYRNGIPEGDFSWYFPNGAIQQKGRKINGDSEGRVASYFPSGRLQSFFHFRQGRKNGLAVEYYPSNIVKVHSWYNEAGQLAFQKAYRENGDPEEQFGEPIIISGQEVDPENNSAFFTIASGLPPELIADFSVRCIFPDKTVKKIPVIPDRNGEIEFSFPFLDGMASGTYHFFMDLRLKLPAGSEHKTYRKEIQAIWDDGIPVLAM